MVASAPRLSPRLLAELERIDDGSASIASLCRALGEFARRQGLVQPSYERVRTLVHASRRWRNRRASTATVVADVVFRTKPPTAFIDHLAGTS